MDKKAKLLPVAIFISGHGSNLQILIDQQHQLGIEIKVVLSNCAQVFGLMRAKKENIPTIVLDHEAFTSRETYGLALKEMILPFCIDYIVLAGFMRILSADFVRHYAGKIINIHPSLLPQYKGLNTHQRVLENQEAYHGATVHFVTEKLDDGANIIQAVLAVQPTDTVSTLANRIQMIEHSIYPMALSWLSEKRLKYENNQVWLDYQLLPQSGWVIS
ncbi:MAG: phosphoribosylglycinamide formyltransferase [Endozoicomonadaceae bacterium]|nr:phosphoribosylglycinamide formyltransferase [Endozoicomonadaceae bacterium]